MINFSIEQNGGEYYGWCTINGDTCERLSENSFLIDGKYEIAFDEKTEFEIITSHPEADRSGGRA